MKYVYLVDTMPQEAHDMNDELNDILDTLDFPEYDLEDLLFTAENYNDDE